MAIDAYFAPDAADYAIAVDEERGALYAHIFLAIHAFFDPYAVIFAHGAIFIGGKRKR